MRFKQYINEITKPTVSKTKKMIESHMAEMFRILNKNNWIMNDNAIVSMLTSMFKKDGILFILGKGKDRHSKYIEGGNIAAEGLLIMIIVSPGVGKAFKQFAKPKRQQIFYDIDKNEFFRNLLDAISHELLHKRQFKASKGKSFEMSPESSKYEFINYLKDPVEMEAFAQMAAVEMKRFGVSKTFDNLLNAFTLVKDMKAKNRFIKKVIKYVEKLK